MWEQNVHFPKLTTLNFQVDLQRAGGAAAEKIPEFFQENKDIKVIMPWPDFPFLAMKKKFFWLGLKEEKSHASSKATVEDSTSKSARWFLKSNFQLQMKCAVTVDAFINHEGTHEGTSSTEPGEEEKMLPRSTTTTDCCLSNFQMQTPY